MLNPLSAILLGFLLGMRHATDADHVIAVSTIVSRERRIVSALLVGALWGIGHSLTILLVGGAILLFDVVIPPRLGLSMEFSVALMLIGLGLANLVRARRRFGSAHSAAGDAHVHAHAHGEQVHTHAHHHDHASGDHAELDHALGGAAGLFARLGPLQTLRPVAVGVVHGLAGSAAIALLVLATIPSPFWGIVYLAVFGLGTVAGMMLVTAANALPLTWSAARFGQADRYLGLASGLLSLGFGLFLAYRIGFVDGLLV